jgi:ribonuclease HII
MYYPNLKEEKKLWKKGYKYVACVDEAGRGPLAGPVVAAVVIIENCKLKIENFKKLKDSKKLSSQKREQFYKLITRNPNIEWGIGIVSEKVIDKINILEATKLVMKRALRNLAKKYFDAIRSDRTYLRQIDFLIIDGNFRINLPIPQKLIVKADEKVFSCAAASILAKVTRDRIMMRYHKKYPKYRFDLHKGYPTKLHLKMLRKYGSCEIHRRSFKPVSKILKIKNTNIKT